MDTFRITLISNVQSNSTENRIGTFITELPKAIKLDETWRVALSEISYSNTWFNIKTPQTVDIVDYEFRSYLTTKCQLSPGRYTIHDVINSVKVVTHNYATNDLAKAPVLLIDEKAHKLRVVLGLSLKRKKLFFKFDQDLEEMLGLADTSLSAEDKASERNDIAIILLKDDYTKPVYEHVEGDDPLDHNFQNYDANDAYDMTGGVRQILVYCDIVDYNIVGNSVAQLMKLVRVPPQDLPFDEQFYYCFEKPDFLPLSVREFNSIKVSLKDDTDQEIIFDHGRVFITLTFKKF